MDNRDLSYKEETKKTYHTYQDIFNQRFESNFQKYNMDKAKLFIKDLKGSRILDAGSGPGSHAVYFKQRGFDVLCIDNSEAMINLCLKKGLWARVMDLENLDFPNGSFDGIWAYASLLHIPKSLIPPIVDKFASILTPEGLLGLSLKEGDGEGLINDSRYPDSKRWFSYFQDNEVRELFSPQFDLLNFELTPASDTKPFLHYIFRLN